MILRKANGDLSVTVKALAVAGMLATIPAVYGIAMTLAPPGSSPEEQAERRRLKTLADDERHRQILIEETRRRLDRL